MSNHLFLSVNNEAVWKNIVIVLVNISEKSISSFVAQYFWGNKKSCLFNKKINVIKSIFHVYGHIN